MTSMKKQQMITLIILTMFILMATQVSSTSHIISDSQSELNDQDVEWNDGMFSGTWYESEDTIEGTLQGILTMARSDQSGLFSGIVFDNEDKQIGQFNGRFFKSFIFGFFQSENVDIPSTAFFGKIMMRDDTTFTATINPVSLKPITINCTYNFSFLPSPTGPYAIGITDQYMIDTSREEFYTENTSDYREFMLKIWYPINPETAINPVDYMDYFTFQWLKNRSPIPLITIKDDAYLSISPHGFKQGILPTDQDTFPVLIFSPGYDGNVEIYTSFIEEMVSQGYVVFSINHPYVSGLTIFPDGRMIKSTSIKPFSFETIVGDAIFVLDYIKSLHENTSIFQGRLDLGHIGMYGHSFGGAATLEVMKRDDRVKAGLTLDGAIGSDLLPESFDKAFLMMLAEESFAENSSKKFLNISGDDGYLLTIMGSTHYAFTDVGLLMSHFIPLIPPEYLLFGTIDAKRMVNITLSYCREFFDVYLKNEPVENLLDLQMVFQEAILTVK